MTALPAAIPAPLPEGPWITTAGGRALPLLTPRPADVDLHAIACALSNLCRFTGHPQTFYSVAQHCCVVHDALPMEARAYGLLHDAHEWAIGDISTPLAEALWQLAPPARNAITLLKDEHDRAIFRACDLAWPMPEDIYALVKDADRRALATEQRDLMAGLCGKDRAEPFPRVIKPWPSPRAAEEWLARFDRLAALGLLRRPGDAR